MYYIVIIQKPFTFVTYPLYYIIYSLCCLSYLLYYTNISTLLSTIKFLIKTYSLIIILFKVIRLALQKISGQWFYPFVLKNSKNVHLSNIMIIIVLWVPLIDNCTIY